MGATEGEEISNEKNEKKQWIGEKKKKKKKGIIRIEKLSLHTMANTLNFETPKLMQHQFTVIAEDKI